MEKGVIYPSVKDKSAEKISRKVAGGVDNVELNKGTFHHSVKVPKLYKCAAKIAQEVAGGAGSIKQLVYDKKHFNTKALFALVATSFQKSSEIEFLLKRTSLLEKETRLDPWLSKILISELLWGKKQLPKSEAKPILTILAYEQAFLAHLSDSSRDNDSDILRTLLLIHIGFYTVHWCVLLWNMHPSIVWSPPHYHIDALTGVKGKVLRTLPFKTNIPINNNYCILSYDAVMDSFNTTSSQQRWCSGKSKSQKKPRYIRINTLKTSINEALELIQEEGWDLQRDAPTNYEEFLEQLSNVNENMVYKDIHVPDLLIFPAGTAFYDHPGYQKGALILQDKASCLPVHILSPPPGSTVLDMCAAPGMKTTQLAAIMNNNGTVYAVERDQKRYEILKAMVEKSGATCVKAINQDVLNCSDKDFPNVEYILVDPSCSGSGMIDRVEIDTKTDAFRLQKLAGFQIKILRSALSRYPNAKRIVYSTCSLNSEENEDVVRQVLETNNQFKLLSAKEFLNHKWINFGSSDFGDIGKFCLYARPERDFTNGFFLAVFERLADGENNEFYNGRIRNYTKSIERKNARRARQNNRDITDANFSSQSEDKEVLSNGNDNSLECSDKSRGEKRKTETKVMPEIHEEFKFQHDTRKKKKKNKVVSVIDYNNFQDNVEEHYSNETAAELDSGETENESDVKSDKKNKKHKKDEDKAKNTFVDENLVTPSDKNQRIASGHYVELNAIGHKKKTKPSKEAFLSDADIHGEEISEVNEVELNLDEQSTRRKSKKHKKIKHHAETKPFQSNHENNEYSQEVNTSTILEDSKIKHDLDPGTNDSVSKKKTKIKKATISFQAHTYGGDEHNSSETGDNKKIKNKKRKKLKEC